MANSNTSVLGTAALVRWYFTRRRVVDFGRTCSAAC